MPMFMCMPPPPPPPPPLPPNESPGGDAGPGPPLCRLPWRPPPPPREPLPGCWRPERRSSGPPG
eukprot:scaffold6686_cov323-Prasinococcus_capsulatus_cf.AAC.1